MMLGRTSKALKYSKAIYLGFLYAVVLYVLVLVSQSDSKELLSYIIFRNVNALLMFFLQPVFFWYPPRYPLPEWKRFKAICDNVHKTALEREDEHAAILSSRLSVWHTIFTPADDLINKVVAELGTAKGMNEEGKDGGKDKSDDGPSRGGKAVQQWLFAQKSGVSILLGGYMLLTAIQQFEAAQFQGPPAAPPPMPPVQPPGMARLCDNTCVLRVGQTVAGCTAGQPCPSQAMNNQCEDGFDGATRTCEVGTDCFDCSYRDVGPPPPPPSAPPALPGQIVVCENTCRAASDIVNSRDNNGNVFSCLFNEPCPEMAANTIGNQQCDAPVPATGQNCMPGTDCADCGPAYIASPSPPPVPSAPPPPPPSFPPALPGRTFVCENTCLGAHNGQNIGGVNCGLNIPCPPVVADGMCQDGTGVDPISICQAGTDCADCGPAYVAFPAPPPTPFAPPPPPPSFPPAVPGGNILCTNTCIGAPGGIVTPDGNCQDGGSGSTQSFCQLGTDCSDCGARYNNPTTGDPPPPAPPYPPSPPPRMPDTACCSEIEVAFVGGATLLTTENHGAQTFCMGLFDKHPTLTNEGRAVYYAQPNGGHAYIYYSYPRWDTTAHAWFCAHNGNAVTSISALMTGTGSTISHFNALTMFGEGCSCPSCSSPDFPNTYFRVRKNSGTQDDASGWSTRTGQAATSCMTRLPPAAPPPLDTSNCCEYVSLNTADVIPTRADVAPNGFPADLPWATDCFGDLPFRKTNNRTHTGRNVFEKNVLIDGVETPLYLFLDEWTITHPGGTQIMSACRAHSNLACVHATCTLTHTSPRFPDAQSCPFRLVAQGGGIAARDWSDLEQTMTQT